MYRPFQHFNVYDPNAIGGFSGASGSVINVANPVAQLYLEDPKVNTNMLIANIFAELTLTNNLK